MISEHWLDIWWNWEITVKFFQSDDGIVVLYLGFCCCCVVVAVVVVF